MAIFFLQKVASFELCGKNQVFRMNIFDSQLAFILSLIAMLCSFAVNIFQCWKKNDSTDNNDPQDNIRMECNTENSTTASRSPLLVPQLMESANFRNYFPERSRYESNFANLSTTEGKKGNQDLKF